MPDFERMASCRAPARSVWKLLYDPARYTEWWEGTERVDVREGMATRYTTQYPGTAFPTAVTGAAEEGAVSISCVATDIVYDWTLAPIPGGCTVRVRVSIPDELADRLPAQEAAMDISISRLVALSEAA